MTRIQGPRLKVQASKPRWFAGTGFIVLAVSLASAKAAGLPPEKLLPDDTLFVATAPDFPRFKAVFDATPQGRLWNDPALKSFRENFLSRWNDEFVKPIEHDLDIRLADYTALAKGQVTVAITRNGRKPGEDRPLGIVLLVDTKDKAAQLKSHLQKARRSWADSGKSARVESVRGFEFFLLPLSESDVPQTLKQFFPQPLEVQEAPPSPTPKTARSADLVIGQADSLLIVGNSLKAIEKIVIRQSGGPMPGLDEVAGFQSGYSAVLSGAPVYAWANLKGLAEIFNGGKPENKPGAIPDPLATPGFERFLGATGLSAVRTVAVAFQHSAEGLHAQWFVNAPESSRQGLFKVLAGEIEDCTPPPFIPADAVKFQRWRLDGQKAWAGLESVMRELSPQSLNAINFILDTANLNAREKEPGFDIRKNLIGNLGDDIITYGKAPRDQTPNALDSPPSIMLVGSPHPDQLCAALKYVLIFMTAQAATPGEREFLGRKILSVPLPSLPFPLMDSRPGPPKTLNYATGSGYVALSTDVAMLEEFLRSGENQGKSLRESPGLADAMQKVTGPGTTLFGYENQVEKIRTQIELWKQQSGTTNTAPLGPFSSLSGVSGPEKSLHELMDFSLLPPWEAISRYFHFTVYGLSATTDGFVLKYFAPAPPGLKESTTASR
jgi:hypothetical protein